MDNGARAFASPFGPISLTRRPEVTDGSLVAWDAADELLLVAFDEARAKLRVDRPKVLVIGDNFGALSVALVQGNLGDITMWSDSELSMAALRSNLERNGHRVSSVATVSSTTVVNQPFDVVLWRVPYDRSFLRYQVDVLARAMRGAVVIGGAMDKYLSPSARTDLALLGDADMRRGQKKAHLFDIRVETDDPAVNDVRKNFGKDIGLNLAGAPNVFGGDGLDLGARVMIDALKSSFPGGVSRVADLGCGTGVLGIVAGKTDPSVHVSFFDESSLAIQNARRNAGANSITNTEFFVADGFAGYTGETFDLIVCNPPFHQRGAVSDAVAFSLMRQARHHLNPEGELWVVGNRHLGYHLKMQRLFGNCQQLAAHPKFVVVRGVREHEKPRARVRFDS
jgi:23S rRNA (guanine1835-N2)-methyltransferase